MKRSGQVNALIFWLQVNKINVSFSLFTLFIICNDWSVHLAGVCERLDYLYWIKPSIVLPRSVIVMGPEM